MLQSELPPPHVQEEASALLRAQGIRAYSQVERLLGWRSIRGMTTKEMACQLGIKDHQLKYLIRRKEIGERQRKLNAAKKEARGMDLVEYQSTELGFRISAPLNWKVTIDGYQSEKDLARTIDIVYQEYLRTLPETRLSKADFRSLAYRSFDAYKFGVPAEKVGTFSAAPLNALGDIGLDVVKIRFDSPIRDSNDLFELDRRPQEEVFWGGRPTRKVRVDGMLGTRYYFIPHGLSAHTGDWLKYSNLYLVDRNIGWIISCTCEARFFDKYKPVFERVALSFERSRG